MQPAASARPRFRIWLALGALTTTVAGLTYAQVTDEPAEPHVAVNVTATLIEPVIETASAEPERSTAAIDPISIMVVASDTAIGRDEPLPLTFYLINRTERPLSVLRSLDGSDVGWRYPKIDVEIRDAEGNLVAPSPMGRCGLVNPLTEQDFVAVPPGGRIDLFGADAFDHYRLRVHNANLAPGTYTVTLHYDLSFAGDDRARRDDRLRDKIDELPKGIYSSPPITIEVK